MGLVRVIYAGALLVIVFITLAVVVVGLGPAWESLYNIGTTNAAVQAQGMKGFYDTTMIGVVGGFATIILGGMIYLIVSAVTREGGRYQR